MSSWSLEKVLPKPLLDDIVLNKCLPVVGAGFSKNAVLPNGQQVPGWREVGALFARDIPGYPTDTPPMEAISTYEQQFGRPKLIERLTDLLHIPDARPGRAHRAFCNCHFDIVITTNFDMLLEQAYEAVAKRCFPVIDECSLCLTGQDARTVLVKFHGDVDHPDHLIATEQDYDGFLTRRPLMATFLAGLLIARTPLFIGYSIDDPDFCQIWQVIGDRLGRHRRMGYALKVGCSDLETARYLRRGIKVINLPGSRIDYGTALADFFERLGDYWDAHYPSASFAAKEEAKPGLVMPLGSLTRLCYFAISRSLLPAFQRDVFPLVYQHSMIPITVEDLRGPGDYSRIGSLLARAQVIVVDVANRWVIGQLSKRQDTRVLAVGRTRPDVLPEGWRFVTVSPDAMMFSETVINEIEEWLALTSRRLLEQWTSESDRLLRKREYRAALVAAVTEFEVALRRASGVGDVRATPLALLLKKAPLEELAIDQDVEAIKAAIQLRNRIVHYDDVHIPRDIRKMIGILRDVTKSLREHLQYAAATRTQ